MRHSSSSSQLLGATGTATCVALTVAMMLSACAPALNELRAADTSRTETINASMQAAVMCLSTTAEEKLNARVSTRFDAELGINEVIVDVAGDTKTQQQGYKALYTVWPRNGKQSNVRYAISASGNSEAAMLDAARALVTACNEKPKPM